MNTLQIKKEIKLKNKIIEQQTKIKLKKKMKQATQHDVQSIAKASQNSRLDASRDIHGEWSVSLVPQRVLQRSP